MTSRSSDFNYKVALASGLKSLQGGRLRQAEEQFRYLVQHFRSADGGYRGLAKVLVAEDDRGGALRTLLDGGAALAKADQRAAAIALYREAVALAPLDLSAHRRLAASLMNSGDNDEAAREFVRFINAAVNADDRERAGSEALHALERLPDNGDIVEAARYIGIEAPPNVSADASPAMQHRVDGPIPSSDDRAAMLRSAFGTSMTEPPQQFELTRAVAPERLKPSPWAGVHVNKPQPAGARPASAVPAAETSAVPSSTAPGTSVDPPGDGKSADPWAAVAAPPQAGADQIPAEADAQTVEETAAHFLASGDSRAAEHALEAARRYIAEGRTDAASDLLLQLVASGVATHDAQRLLVDVARTLGKKDVAKAKVELLVEALKLDGRMDLAAEVEQQAEAS